MKKHVWSLYSCSPDWDFCLFTHTKKFYLTYPIPTHGKDIKHTSACLHVKVMSSCNLLWCISMYSGTSGNLFKKILRCAIKWWARKRIYYLCEDGIEKSIPCDHWATLMMPISDPLEGVFCPTLTLMIDSYNIVDDCTGASPALQYVILDNILK